MLSQRWRNISISLKTSFTASIAQFHSTSVFSDKSRINSASNSSIRFTCTVKEKGRRTGAKKTLDNLLFHHGINDPLQNEWHFGPNPLIRDRHMKKKPPPGRGKKPRDKKTKRWHREGNLDYEFGTDANNTFENKWREGWTNQSQKSSYTKDSKSGFEWREGWCWTTQSQRRKTWNNESCDDEPLVVGSRSERVVLGLPLVGHLKLDDVKNAFRSAALKWHPDKHQGPSQVVAQEKFKLCVDAYKSLCSALS